ncbi:pantoate--beta-alanine ligase [Paracoccus xiamenensis]|uniref:pantoate--beta-alanine ligase n=1 Tax=Paracoccus xiamenensis TaxID=2714901 RepID=UPI00140769A1|nr:pantoate--beta-alanine ligase [Paracoccus xiamenensis]NHF74102.1 pantoate--beta-alanine ligase [Paracoccus xiamenensis]
MSAPIVTSLDELRRATQAWRRAGQRVGVVPTMGALHDGHLSLVRAAKAECDRVIVTLFVNPRQFNSAEDYDKYPRTELADAELLGPLGIDALFVPDGAQVYPPGHATTVSVSGITDTLEGAHRPGHFDGVATVVTMLFNMTQADRAYFGEKDWQQLQLVRRLVADLKLPVEIVGCPTVRADDGLAMSSRNQRLSVTARQQARALPEALLAAAAAIGSGANVDDVLTQTRETLAQNGIGPVEYIELRDSESLRPPRPCHPRRLLVAAWLDGVRLIDNVEVPPAN